MHALCEQESSIYAALRGQRCKSVKTFLIVVKYNKFKIYIERENKKKNALLHSPCKESSNHADFCSVGKITVSVKTDKVSEKLRR